MASLARSTRAVARCDAARAAIFVCDIQERFKPLIHNSATIINRSAFMLETCKILDIPALATLQYPKIFGQMVPELKMEGIPCFEKSNFSMMTPEMAAAFESLDKDVIIIVGIEAHVCIQQTVLDLVDLGKEVHVICDAVSSQKSYDREIALRKMENVGAHLTTAESCAFDLLRGSKHPKFKEVSSLIKEYNMGIEDEFSNGKM